MWALKPTELEEDPLPGALERTLRVWSRTCNVTAGLEITGEAYRLSTQAEITLLRIVQEACANVAKHAKATKVEVTLRHASKGARNKEITEKIGVSEATVKSHLSSIYQKLQVNDRTAAVTAAIREGIIAP